MNARGFWGFVGILGCLAIAGCGNKKSSPKSEEAAEQKDQDITSAYLTAFVGISASPRADLRVHEDGKFTLETLDEELRWYPDGSSKQHYAYCNIQRAGTIQLLQRENQKIMRLKLTERKVLSGRADAGRSDRETPTDICQKAIEVMGQDGEIDLSIAAQAGRQFLLTNHYDGNTPRILYFESTSVRNGLRADSMLRGELAFLFTASGATTNVTELLSSVLNSSYSPCDTRLEGNTFGLKPEFRTLQATSDQCNLDAKLGFEVLSTGRRVFIRKAPSSSESIHVDDDASAGGVCSKFKALLTSTSQEELFELNDLQAIKGIGPLSGFHFCKNYR